MKSILVSVAILFAVVINSVIQCCSALNVVIAGGTGKIGQTVASKLSPQDQVTILTRNAFLAAAPARVTEVFGWVGQRYLELHPNIKLRDWDGGDLLDIVGKDWVGWQDDTLAKADVVVNVVGGYTAQREMATERLVRESRRVNPNALQICVSPSEDDLTILSPGMPTAKAKRIQLCEDMVTKNCLNTKALRCEAYKFEETCQTILDAISSAR